MQDVHAIPSHKPAWDYGTMDAYVVSFLSFEGNLAEKTAHLIELIEQDERYLRVRNSRTGPLSFFRPDVMKNKMDVHAYVVQD